MIEFQLRQNQADNERYQDIVEALIALRTQEQPIVIRNALGSLSMQSWRDCLSNQCGYLPDRRHFNYSEGMELSDWWEISYQPSKATSYAYSNTEQPLHTDNAWFPDPAEINFFAMKKQAQSGGRQLIYRLERLINDLMDKDLSLYDDLSSVPVVIRKGDTDLFHETTIIQNKKQPRIFWNYYRTERSNEDIDKLCQRFFDFLALQKNTSSVEKIMANTSDCFAFNDTFLLHGREAFEVTKPFDRVLYQSMWKIKETK